MNLKYNDLKHDNVKIYSLPLNLYILKFCINIMNFFINHKILYIL